MSKIDKRQYSKQEWHRIREQRRIAKMQRKMSRIPQSSPAKKSNQIAFVLGNGTSTENTAMKFAAANKHGHCQRNVAATTAGPARSLGDAFRQDLAMEIRLTHYL